MPLRVYQSRVCYFYLNVHTKQQCSKYKLLLPVCGDIGTIVSVQCLELVTCFEAICLRGFTYCSFVHVWHYGDCSWVIPVELSMAITDVFSSAE